MKIRQKLYVLFSILCIAITAVLLINFSSISKLRTGNNVLYDNVLMASQFTQSARHRFSEIDSNLITGFLETEPSKRADKWSQAKEGVVSLNEDLDVVAERSLNAEFKAAVNEIQKDTKSVEEWIKPLVEPSKTAVEADTKVLQKWLKLEIREKISKSLGDLIDKMTAYGYDYRNESDKQYALILRLFIVSSTLLVVFLICFVWILISSMLRPLLQLTNICETISNGDPTIRVPLKGRDEFTILGKAFNQMLDQLEQKERLLQSEIRKIKSLLDNMKQAVFAINKQSNVVEPVSKFSQAVFQLPIVGKKIHEFLYKDINQNDEKFAAIASGLVTVFGEDEMQWSLIEDNFPTKLEWKNPGGDIRNIRINYSPLYDEGGLLEQILIVAEDVTELEKLENSNRKAQAEAKRNIDRLEELVRVKQGDLKSFFTSTKDLIAEVLKGAENITGVSPEFKALILRNFHTIKGVSRILRMNSLSSIVHTFESETIHYFEKTAPIDWKWTSIQPVIQSIEADITEYARLSEIMLGKKLHNFATQGGLSSSADVGEKNEPQVYVYQSQFTVLDKWVQIRSEETPLSKDFFPILVQRIKALQYIPLNLLKSNFVIMIQDLSDDLKKKTELQWRADGVYVPAHLNELIQNVLVHLTRNTIDHGIESPEERIKLGKSEAGTLLIEAQVAGRLEDQITIKIKDDGRGVLVDHIVAKVRAAGNIPGPELDKMTPKQKANLIFLSNISTKESATEISGRGVGMDAVKSMIEAVNGTIELETKPGQGTTFTILVPILKPIKIDKLVTHKRGVIE